MSGERNDSEPTIYVLWHPKCAIGRDLAEAIYKWFRPELGRGINVHFRCRLLVEDLGAAKSKVEEKDMAESLAVGWSKAFDIPGVEYPKALGTAPKVPFQYILPLIDAHMINDTNWRRGLQATVPECDNDRCRLVIPVALDHTAYNIGGNLSEQNFIRPTSLDKEDLRKWAKGELRDEDKVLDNATRSLVKQVTEVLCDYMLIWKHQRVEYRDDSIGGAINERVKKIKIFLSHAKIDGKSPARRLRDYIYGQTQLAAFYDENDIPAASHFSKVLEKTLNDDETAAFVAIRSKAYAKSPWCRREIQLFRQPVEVKSSKSVQLDGGEMPSYWRMNPVLVVDALTDGDITSGVPEVGNATIVRWSNTEADHEEKIVSMLMRDVLLGEFYAMKGLSKDGESDSVVINWFPDPTSLLRLTRLLKGREELKKVIYPGLGLSKVELKVLEDFFPDVTFHTFEEWGAAGTSDRCDSPLSFQKKRSDGRLRQVALLFSFEQDELLEIGYGRAHLAELITAIARPLMRADIDVAHCGQWKSKEEKVKYKFVDELLAIASSESNDGPASPGTFSDGSDGRVVLYSSWPYCEKIDPYMEAEWINCCNVVRVHQKAIEIPDDRQVKGEISSLFSDQAVFNAAQALSMMRRWAVLGVRKSAEYCKDGQGRVVRSGAVVILGGKLTEFAGIMPSAFEETLFALEYNVPLFILGGFGGAAEVLANAILKPRSDWGGITVDGDRFEGTSMEKALSFVWHRDHSPRLARAVRYLEEERDPGELTSDDPKLKEFLNSISIKEQYDCLNGLLEKRRGMSVSHGCLELEEEKVLMTTRDMKRAAELVLKGLAKLDTGK